MRQLMVMALLVSQIAVSAPALADGLLHSPNPVKAAILQLDPKAYTREDKLVRFSNGAEYILVETNTPSKDPVSVVKQSPESSKTPDLILFSDGSALIRLVKLPDGRQSLPVLSELPDSVRQGLIPQGFSFPKNFFLPTAWKALSGNLLTHVSAMSNTVGASQNQVAVLANQSKTLKVWDLAQAKEVRSIALPCSAQHLLTVSNELAYASCVDQPTYLRIPLASGDVTSIALPAVSSDSIYDTRYNQIYIAYSNLATLDVLKPGTVKLQSIALTYPVQRLAFSGFRKQVYALGVLTDKDIPPVSVHKTRTIPLFGRRPQSPESEKVDLATLHVPIQIINTDNLTFEKILPSLPGATQLMIQDEKLLWVYSPVGKQLQAFDLRWQEPSPAFALKETPVAFASDRTWLYLLYPESNTVGRLNVTHYDWGTPIALEPGRKTASLLLDPTESIAYVLSADPAGIEIINLNRAEWVGTHVSSDLLWAKDLAWVGSADTLTAEKQVQIKFQNGRLLLQNVQGSPLESWLSAPHAPQNSQAPQEPVKTQTNP